MNTTGKTQLPLPGGSIFTCLAGEPGAGRLPLIVAGKPAPVAVDPGDHPGVTRAAQDLAADLGRVAGESPAVMLSADAGHQDTLIVVGTVGHSVLIDGLVRTGKIDAAGIAGKWESFLIQTVEAPFPGVQRALVVAGSDKRGAVFGVYEVSRQAGVSPWYWWADVPVEKRRELYALPGIFISGEPKVRYRGIFLNDEAPALTEWAKEKFGGLNHVFYEKVFELILRLGGNFLWPAMWGKAFYDDDPENPRLADLYGVVIGTSHHEPCMRAHDEWRRFGKGAWNYEKNQTVLGDFWREGVRRMGDFESLVTVGMRGDGDEPMSEENNIALLQRIIADQRTIIGAVRQRDPREVKQVWAVYKEVQDYYDNGMEVSDDITLLLCDDNWGNIRRVPRPEKRNRPGGYGMYYHFDYVGGPRNYKWLNTSPIPRVWEQMDLAYRTGIDRLWVVNVGDLKPMEFPISFFLDLARDPDRMTVERMADYTADWAARQFGPAHAPAIASIISRYTKYNGRRKPELLAPETYSLLHYREAEIVVDDYNKLLGEARALAKRLPDKYRDAYYQLVLHPVEACANLNELYVLTAKNRLYAAQGRALTNALAARVRELFARDVMITQTYNDKLAGGKWHHFMDQTHIGYTYWQQPEVNAIPDLVEIKVTDGAIMGVAVEGSVEAWPGAAGEPELPGFDPYADQEHFIEVFNRGKKPFDFTASPSGPWITVSPLTAKVETEVRLRVRIDWRKAPAGEARAVIALQGPAGQTVNVMVPIRHSAFPERETVKGFIECSGLVSMEAEHFSAAVDSATVHWRRLPDLGRTGSAMAALPVTAPSGSPGQDGARLEYRMHLFTTGPVRVMVYVAPSLDFANRGGLRYAVSFDDDKPVTVNLHAGETLSTWEQSVADSIRVGVSEHCLGRPGDHMLKFWRMDAGVVLQKIVVDLGGVKPSYLGPPETFFQA